MIKIPARLVCNDAGETNCIVFVDNLQLARKALEPHISSVVSKLDFIGAFGVSVFVHKLEDLEGLSVVNAVAPEVNCMVCSSPPNPSPLTPNLSPLIPNLSPLVTVAVIDTGIRPHIDFLMPRVRVRAFVDFVSGKKLPYDDNGHGTAVSGILCGNGLCGGSKGANENLDLVAIKAIGKNGEAGSLKILSAMQWVYDNRDKYNIKVLCMSFGAEPVEGRVDPLSLGAEALWKKGIVVVASAGNAGPKKNTIKSPGINKNIITVGGACLRSEYEDYKNIQKAKSEKNSEASPYSKATQGTFEGGKEKSSVGSLRGDSKLWPVEVADFSSRGSENLLKPDLIAPSVKINSTALAQNYGVFTGTSMAAPLVAARCVEILSNNPTANPDRVKEILLRNLKPTGHGRQDGGLGYLE